MKVLVLGSGGREHTLVWKLAQSSALTDLLALPGNPGMENLARRIRANPDDISEVVETAKREVVDLVVIGPENPLAAGLVDALSDAKIPAFGPSRAAAQIESSKAFAKDLMLSCNVPTADYEVFDDPRAAREYFGSCSLPKVIKADGLAAGKGVTVVNDRQEGLTILAELMEQERLGSAGRRVIIEECLEGPELSVMAITDGIEVVPLVAAQDYKSIREHGEGPNTGGMGSYSPVPFCDEPLMTQIESSVLRPVIDEMRRRGTPFRGVLYGGLMLTDAGPKVLEFNCRFGDPETQVVLPRLASDLLPLLLASAGVTDDFKRQAQAIRWRNEAAVCVILASNGYPGPYEKGHPIKGLEHVPEDVLVFHAGTEQANDGLVTAGGRVLGVTAVGDGLARASERAYDAVEGISFRGVQFRRDIAQL